MLDPRRSHGIGNQKVLETEAATSEEEAEGSTEAQALTPHYADCDRSYVCNCIDLMCASQICSTQGPHSEPCV